MTDTKKHAPTITDGRAPLEVLIMSALRQFGDFHPDTIDGDTVLMMIEFANDILEEIRNHPYWDDTVLDDYVSSTDVRPVPDRIIRTGLLAMYALQQGSDKGPYLEKKYFRALNQSLWQRLNMTNEDGGGERSPVLQMRPMDSPIDQSVITGQEQNSDDS